MSGSSSSVLPGIPEHIPEHPPRIMIAWGRTNEFFNQLRTDANDEHQGHWAIHEKLPQLSVPKGALYFTPPGDQPYPIRSTYSATVLAIRRHY